MLLPLHKTNNYGTLHNVPVDVLRLRCLNTKHEATSAIYWCVIMCLEPLGVGTRTRIIVFEVFDLRLTAGKPRSQTRSCRLFSYGVC